MSEIQNSSKLLIISDIQNGRVHVSETCQEKTLIKFFELLNPNLTSELGSFFKIQKNAETFSVAV